MDDRDAIEPDDADWTWVLERPCPQCGLDLSTVDPRAVAAMVRENAAAWEAVLARDPSWVTRRPRPDKWSPLEYACHVRDVFTVFDRRLQLMLSEDGPRFENWDQDATAIADRYDRQDPAEVSPQLAGSATVLAERFESVSGESWERTGYRSDGASFTIASFALYFIHDPVHHLADVAAGSGTPRASASA